MRYLDGADHRLNIAPPPIGTHFSLLARWRGTFVLLPAYVRFPFPAGINASPCEVDVERVNAIASAIPRSTSPRRSSVVVIGAEFMTLDIRCSKSVSRSVSLSLLFFVYFFILNEGREEGGRGERLAMRRSSDFPLEPRSTKVSSKGRVFPFKS